MKKVQLTQEGFLRLKKEHQELKEIRRPKVVDTLQKARAMGDLSENSAYSAAKEELALVEGRILEIEAILKSVDIIKNGQNNDKVELGVSVTVEVNGKKEQYQIVGEYEADPMSKKLSHTSPLGQGLMGKKVGEEVQINVPAGKVTYIILKIN